MNGPRMNAVITLILCVIVAFAIATSHLALTDIYHGTEPNLEVEWWIVRSTFILLGFLIISASLLARGVLRGINSESQA